MKKASFIFKFKKYKTMLVENDQRMISLKKHNEFNNKLIVKHVDKMTTLIYFLDICVIIHKTPGFFKKCLTFEFLDGKETLRTHY